MLQRDQCVEFHAAWGAYHRVKLPRAGRDMFYDAATAELLIATSTSDVFRLDLEAGVFRQSYSSLTGAQAINVSNICTCDNNFKEYQGAPYSSIDWYGL